MKLDMRNKVCPYPVIETKKLLRKMQKNDTVEVLVDNLIATENLQKMAIELGFDKNFSIVKNSDIEYLVTINKGEGKEERKEENTLVTDNDKKNIIVISTDTMGNGDEQLSKKLLEGFIYSLTEQEENILPAYIVFYNKGVFLTANNKKTIEDLLVLEQKGVKMLSCGLCLDFYNLKDDLQVGEVTNMYKIANLLLTHNNININ